jgi:5-methylcytosine-specific restriction enzyme subunit McrC
VTATATIAFATEMPEWSTLELPGVELTDGDRRLAAALGAGNTRLVVDELRDRVRVTSRSWIGVIRFETFEVRVVPKVAGGNLGVLRMLEYASGLSALSRLESARTIRTAKEGRLADLLGVLLAEATSRLVRDGLLSDYVTREEALTTLRGRLRMNDQIRRRYLQVDGLECRFDEQESDIVENRLLGAALTIARRVCADEDVRRSVSKYHSVLSEVCEPAAFDPQSAELELVYHRRNEHYRTAHELAWVFVRALAVSDLYAPGSHGSFAFLIDMNPLFERFATRLLTDALAGGAVSVRPQFRDQTLIVEEPLLRRYAAIVPDILLEWSDPHGRRRIPIDAKYKLYDEDKIDSADVYQTFFYAYAYARHIDQDLDQVRAVILYPASRPGGRGARLLVRRASGATSARIAAVPVDIDEALRAIAERRLRGLALIRSFLELPARLMGV